MFDRIALQMLVTNLDLNRMSAKEAKEYVLKNYRIELAGRTKDAIIRSMSNIVKASEAVAPHTSVHVVVEANCPDDQLHADDEGVAGTYDVGVPPQLSEGIQAGLALEAFHENIGIKVLEDFDISVVNPATRLEMHEADGFDPEKQTLSAEFYGHI
jgi:hypothetical protein